MSTSTAAKPAWAAQTMLGCALLACVVLCYRTAWLSDDAMISLRTVYNWLHSFGLRWNVDERVQTFTHPLWLMLLTAAHACTGEPFFSALYLSWLVSTLAMACLLFACPGPAFDRLIACAALSFSQAFGDFSSGGLENPLTHLFVVSFVALYARDAVLPPRKRNLCLALIAGLAALNRMDAALLFAPALAHVAWRDRREVPLRLYFVGALPLVAWEVFALIYYGFPFPNTAYAKLSQDQGETLARWQLGLSYLRNSLTNDPITLGSLLASAGLCAARRDAKHLWLLLGAFAYVLYTVSVGGDFMMGRFLSAPLCMAVACLACGAWLVELRWRVVTLALVTLLASLGRFAPPLTSSEHKMAEGEPEVNELGIHNERRMFFEQSSLLHAARVQPLHPQHRWARNGKELKKRVASDPVQRVQLVDAIGYAGYYAGPAVHIVDAWALADALIARLPPVTGKYGHYPRVIPLGYVDTLRAHANRILDPALARYYRELALVISGPIWSAERFRAIWRLNSGALDELLDHYAFVRSSRLRVRLQFRNPGAYAYVTAYVWNDDRTAGYELDQASSKDNGYELEWEISPEQVRLLEPDAAVRSASLDGLAPNGMFTVSVGFAEARGKPLREVHELHYRYRLQGPRIDAQRQPKPLWNDDFPDGPWHEGRADKVLGPESTTAAP